MLVSDSALDYFTGHLDVLWKVPVAVALLAVYYAVIGVAISSLTDRRIVAGAAVIGLFLVTSIASAIFVGDFEFERRLGRRARSTCSRCPCTCATSCSSATSIRGSPLTGVTQRRAARDRHLRRGADRRRSWCCCAATAGWNDDRHRRRRARTIPRS